MVVKQKCADSAKLVWIFWIFLK